MSFPIQPHIRHCVCRRVCLFAIAFAFASSAAPAATININTGTTIDTLWDHTGDSLVVGQSASGTLAILGTGTVKNTTLYLGNGSAYTGVLTIAAGGLLDATNALTVGSNGAGIFTLDEGASARTLGAAVIGSAATATGTATINGYWSNSGFSLTVGANGHGALFIGQTGAIALGNGATGIGGGAATNSTGTGTGELSVAGLLLSNTNTSNGYFIVGNAGAGTLEILPTGTVVSGIAYIAYGTSAAGPSTGSATISGFWQNQGSLTLGRAGAGTLVIENGGTVRNNGVTIGAAAGGSGTAVIRGHWDNNGALNYGNYAGATADITVKNGGRLTNTTGGIVLANILGSTATLTIETGGLLQNTGGAITIGNHGSATLAIEAGGTLAQGPNSLTIGAFGDGGHGTLTVAGYLEVLAPNSGNAIIIGSSGTGTLEILSGGSAFTGTNPATTAYIGYEAAGSGSATIAGAWRQGGNLTLGRNNSTATLTITATGAVTVGRAYSQGVNSALVFDFTGAPADRGAFLTAQNINLTAGGTLVITNYTPVANPARASELAQILLHSDNAITGAFTDTILPDFSAVVPDFSFLTAPSLFVRNNRDYLIGAQLLWHSAATAASGTFDLAAGQTFDIDTSLADHPDAATGPASFATGWDGRTLDKTGGGLLTLSATNTYTGDTNIHGGTLAITGHTGGDSASIAVTLDATAAATVSGLWQNTGFLRVGQRGAGTLDVLSTGTVSASNIYLGDTTGARGVVTVQTGGWLQSANRLHVGHSGTGVLDIQAGASVTVGGTAVNAYESIIGALAHSSGSASVAGLWTSTYFYVGQSGSGVLDIAATGAVINDHGFIGSAHSGAGHASVAGLWQNTAGLGIGDFGAGMLDVAATGTVIAGDSTLGLTDGATGSARVAGLWENTGSLKNGVAGAGSLSIAATGTINIAGAYSQNALSTLHVDLPAAPARDDAYINAATATVSGALSASVDTVNYAASSQLPALRTFLRTTSGITGSFSAATLTNTNVPDYLALNAAIDGNDYKLGLGLRWNTASSESHGAFMLDAAQTFTLDTSLADHPDAATASFATGWDGRSLAKNGDGTLIIAAASTYTGATTINAGILQIGDGGTAGSVAGDIANSSTLTFNRSDAATLAGRITGPGHLLQQGTGTLTLTGDTVAATTIDVATGLLSLGDATHAVAATAGRLDVAAGAGLALGRDSTLAVSQTLSLGNNATLDLIIGGGSGPVITAADILIGSGVNLNLAGVTGATSMPFTLIAAATGSIAGDFATIIGGAGASVDYLTISTAKTADAKAYVIDASLTWNQPGDTRHGAFTIGDGGSFTVGQILADKTAGAPTGWDGKSLDKQGSGALILAAANTYTGTTNVSAGTLRLAAANAIAASAAVTLSSTATLIAGAAQQLNNLSGSGTLTASETINLKSETATTFAGVITGAGALDKTGAATLTLTGNNTRTGATTISEGKLTATTAAAPGTGSITIAGDAALEFALASDGAFSGLIAGSGAFAKTGAATLTLLGPTFAASTANVTGGTLAFGNATTAVAASANRLDVAAGAGLALGRDTTLAVSQTLAFGNNATLDLIVGSASGPSITAADVTIASGVTLNVAGVTAATSMPFTLIAATTGAIAGDFDAITIGGVSGTTDYLGITAQKTAGSKTYLLDIILAWNQTGAARHGAFTLAAGSTFTIDEALSDKTASAATGWDGRSLTKKGAGTLILAADNTYTGTTTITAGILQIGSGGATGAVAGDIVNSATLVFNRSDAVTHAGLISGAGNLIQQGAGTLTLTADNTHTGTTIIDAGMLRLGDGGSTGSIAGDIVNNAVLAFDRSDTVTHAGVISGSGALVQQGAGTLVLTAASTHTGTTIIDAGALRVDGSLGGAGIVNGSTLATGANGLLAAAIDNRAGATLLNAGHVTGSITNAGDITNSGRITGDIINTGAITNTGALAAIDNRAGASLTVTGSGAITGLLANAGLATVGDLPAGALNTGTLRLRADAANAAATVTFASLDNTGLVEIGAHDNYATLAAGVISGTGRFLLPVNSDTGGHSTLTFASLSSAGSGAPVLVIDAIGGGALDAATVLSQSVTGPGVENIIVENFNWGLLEYSGSINPGGTWRIANTAYSPAGALAAGVVLLHHSAWSAAQNSLSQHMDSLRFSQGLPQNTQPATPAQPDTSASLSDSVWVTAYGRQLDAGASVVGRPFRQHMYGLLAGTDHDWRLGGEGKSTLTLGLYIGAATGTLDLDSDSAIATDTARLRGAQGGLYASWLHAAGWYAGATLDFGSQTNRLETGADRADYSQWDIGGSLAIGRAFTTKRGWFVDPQLQAGYMRYFAKNYRFGPDDLTAADLDVLQFRLAARLGRTIRLARHGLLQPHLRLGGAQLSTGGGEVRDASQIFRGERGVRADIAGSRLELGGGLLWQIDPRNQLRLDYDANFGGNYDTPWSLTAGFAHRF